MSRGLEQRVLALAAVSRAAHRGILSPDCCLMATRTGLAALERWHVKARPLLVDATAYNREAAHGDATKPPAWMVAIDFERTDGIAGHVVIVGKVGAQKFLLDLSAYQMDRPAKGIHLPAGVAVRVDKPFVGSWRVGCELADHGALVYSQHPRPDSVPWAAGPDWTLPTPRHRATFEQVLERLLSLSELALRPTDFSGIREGNAS